MKNQELSILKAIAICYKPYLKPEEAMIYCNLGHTQLAKKLSECGIYKNSSGYYKKEDLDLMMSGTSSKLLEAAKKLKL
jgi:hypothetical protein